MINKILTKFDILPKNSLKSIYLNLYTLNHTVLGVYFVLAVKKNGINHLIFEI